MKALLCSILIVLPILAFSQKTRSTEISMPGATVTVERPSASQPTDSNHGSRGGGPGEDRAPSSQKKDEGGGGEAPSGDGSKGGGSFTAMTISSFAKYMQSVAKIPFNRRNIMTEGYARVGGKAKMRADFDVFQGVESVKQTARGPVTVKQDPSGGSVSIREWGTKADLPTMEINIPGRPSVEIKYYPLTSSYTDGTLLYEKSPQRIALFIENMFLTTREFVDERGLSSLEISPTFYLKNTRNRPFIVVFYFVDVNGNKIRYIGANPTYSSSVKGYIGNEMSFQVEEDHFPGAPYAKFKFSFRDIYYSYSSVSFPAGGNHTVNCVLRIYEPDENWETGYRPVASIRSTFKCNSTGLVE